MILGAVLAGGQARRFGSDKAQALYRGERMIDRVTAALSAQCDVVVMCGRIEHGFASIPDWPAPALGPLGGLAAALRHAETRGFAHVLSAGVDVPNLPRDMVAMLTGEGAAIVASQPVIGLWPVDAFAGLESFLNDGGRGLYRFAERISARQVTPPVALLNVNRPEDLPQD
ncbi:molybdenum cofactor guanylyltransferase [Erythrobacter sp. R86502]|uniref:molybdenum cofactor guanylyltransferase n=1 Tax=Erythrobacter sp. R86502 TaxID=3093846 RepID=UPI0036D216D1